MSRRTLKLDDRLYDYLLATSLREPEVLARLRAETAEHPHAGMQVSPEQGQLLALLVRLTGARRCLEVGVFTGYSSTCVALALPEDGVLVALDVSEQYTAVARRYWEQAGVSQRIDLRLAPALDSLDAMLAAGESGRFDFAFLDADKSHYLDYYQRVLDLLRPGGLLAVDNVLWSGRVADPADTSDDTVAIRRLNAHMHADERVDMSLVPIGDGLMLARKR